LWLLAGVVVVVITAGAAAQVVLELRQVFL
jgi:hypothetical protein